MPLDFEYTEDQQLLQKSVRDFARKELTKERAVEYSRKHEFPWDIYRKMGSLGYIGVNWPSEFGGQDMGFTEKLLIGYELVKAEPELGFTVCGGIFAAEIICHHGTEEQKKKWLPLLASGEIVSAGCFTEPNGGSDLSRVLDTRAVKDGNDWVINGEKCFITNCTTASIFITLTQTNPQCTPPYRGQTDFIVERSPNVETRPYQGPLGWHTSPKGEVVFNDVRVSEDSIVGGPKNENRGAYMALAFLDESRLYVGMRAAAVAEAAMEKAIEYTKERHAFGRKIAGFQGLAYRIVEMQTRIEALKALCAKGLWTKERARIDSSLRDESIKINSMCKWLGARTAVEACDLAVDVLGGSGFFHEEDVTRWYAFVKALELVEGTKEIQKNHIARVVFGNELTRSF